MARIWLRVYLDEERFFGPGKIALLEAVDTHGSISGAARSMKMAYRHAWELIDAMNRGFKRPVVETASGGRAGGGATLTEWGHELVERYHRIETTARRAVALDLEALADETRRVPRRR